MRVGIVTGEVAVTVGATQQGMVAGDPVNTASRVQSAAAPGQVWVDDTTRTLTQGLVSYLDAGSHAMKGKTHPMQLWAAQSVLTTADGFRRIDGLEAPLIGRTRELRLITEQFHGVQEDGRPCLIIVSGDPGVGKTRLGWEFDKYVDGLPGALRWHSSRCPSYGEGIAFHALADMVRGRLQALVYEAVPDAESPDQRDLADEALVERGLDRLGIAAEERTWLEPRLSCLLGIGAITSYAREDLFHAWATFFQRIGTLDGPAPETVALLVDDAQYADDGLIAFLEYLLAVAAFPVFVMLLARPALIEKHPDLLTNRRVSAVHLEPLTNVQMLDLVDALVAGLPDDTRASLVERSEGVPLFAVETVRSLIDRDLVIPREGRYVVNPGAQVDFDAISAPASLHALLAARLDALPALQQQVVQAASVIGAAFTADQLAALVGPQVDVTEPLVALVRAQVLRREADRLSAEHGHYQFVQSALRNVALGTLARRERKRLHLAMAEHLERDAGDDPSADVAGVLAQHLLDAADAVPEDSDAASLVGQAVTHLRRAAKWASALGAPAQAAAHLTTALSHTTDGQERALIQLDLAKDLLAAQRLSEGREHAAAATDYFDRVGDTANAAFAAALVADADALAGAIERARQSLDDRLRGVAGQPDLVPAELALVVSYGRVALFAGDDNLLDLANREVLLAARTSQSDLIESYLTLGFAYQALGVHPLASLLLEEAARFYEAERDVLGAARILANLVSFWYLEDTARAADTGERALTLADQTGQGTWTSLARINLATALWLRGEWDRVPGLMQEATSTFALAYRQLTDAAIASARGVQFVPVELRGSDVEGFASAQGVELTAQLLVAADQGEPIEDLALSALNSVHPAAGFDDDFVIPFLVVCEVATSIGDIGTLRAVAAVLDGFPDTRRPVGMRAVESLLRAELAVVDGGDPEDLFLESMRLAEQWQAAPTLARAQSAYARWLVQQDRAAEATPLIAAARATFDRIGARAWREVLDQTLPLAADLAT